MGTTHNLYSYKDKSISIKEVFQDLRSINDTLCIGDNKTFYHQFTLKSAKIAEELSSQFDVKHGQLFSSFNLSNYDKLDALFELVTSCQWISFCNAIEDVVIRTYLHYWMEIEGPKLRVSIIPTVTEDFSHMKKELIETLEILRSQHLINLKNDELSSLVTNLIETNLVANGRFSYESNGVGFSASADFIPAGSKQIRPSGVRLVFDETYIKLNGGITNTSKKLYEGLNSIFDNNKYQIEGSISFDYNNKTFETLNALNFLDVRIRSFLDLNKNPHFTADHLALTSTYGGTIAIDNFDWKNSEPNYLDNKIHLELMNSNEWDLEIGIAKQINEEYYFNIELLINKELDFLGSE